jgi:hypothetical protein
MTPYKRGRQVAFTPYSQPQPGGSMSMNQADISAFPTVSSRPMMLQCEWPLKSSVTTKLSISFISTSSFLAAEAPKPDVPVSSHQSAGMSIDRSSMFKPKVNSEENKEAPRSSKDCHQRRQKCKELVVKKRELAERQASAAASTAPATAAAQGESQDAASVVPDAAFSNSAADVDLNSRIEEFFEEFQGIGTNSYGCE